ncbi:endonuclease NucS domain-containing protein [Paenibacillus illinoisensis]|uniref:endonuclease NucS domain-containing protein n=1 Tax=Paenibacillus illinoisensis TaxID=59845 RepID=UPI003D9961D6
MLKIEEKIRKYIASNLSFISPELNLVKEEFELKNPYGAKGYVDILATDQEGNYVIIEIKRSNQAAREALNEISKYPMLLKHKFRVKPSEIRIIIVSSEWHELLTPYSEFILSTNYRTEAYMITLDENNIPITKQEIQPIDNPISKKLSRNHLSFLYETYEKAHNEISNLRKHLEQCGLTDYVILRMHSDANIPYPYSLYVAIQKYDVDYYFQNLKLLLQKEKWKENEILDHIEELIKEKENYYQNDTEGYTIYLEDLILQHVVPNIICDTLESSHPEKLLGSINRSWSTDNIIRGGIFQEDIRLSDQAIIHEELLGLSGENFEMFVTQGHSNNKAKIIEIEENLESVLLWNKVWRSHILTIINKAKKSKDFSLSLNIYDPGRILESLLAYINGNDTALPFYTLYIDNNTEGKTDIYYGLIQWNGKQADILELFNNYYRNDIMEYHFNRFDFNQNLNIQNKLGLEYVTNLIEISHDMETMSSIEVLHGELIHSKEKQSNMPQFIEAHKTGLTQLLEYFKAKTYSFFG